jgi:hypothetical protein
MLTQEFLLPRESPGHPPAVVGVPKPCFVIANFLADSVKCASLNKLDFGSALLIEAEANLLLVSLLAQIDARKENKSQVLKGPHVGDAASMIPVNLQALTRESNAERPGCYMGSGAISSFGRSLIEAISR